MKNRPGELITAWCMCAFLCLAAARLNAQTIDRPVEYMARIFVITEIAVSQGSVSFAIDILDEASANKKYTLLPNESSVDRFHEARQKTLEKTGKVELSLGEGIVVRSGRTVFSLRLKAIVDGIALVEVRQGDGNSVSGNVPEHFYSRIDGKYEKEAATVQKKTVIKGRFEAATGCMGNVQDILVIDFLNKCEEIDGYIGRMVEVEGVVYKRPCLSDGKCRGGYGIKDIESIKITEE